MIELIDLLRGTHDESAPVSVAMRDAVIIPTTMQLPMALDRMRQTRNEMACVVDEYGNFDGILTIEDLTEEIIGEISDEHDLNISETINVGADHWTLPGDVHLDEIERLIGHDLPRGGGETIAGLLINEYGDLVPEGETVRIALPEKPSETIQGLQIERWLDVEVTEVERHVPSQLIVRLREHDHDHDAERPDGDAPGDGTEGVKSR